MANHRHAREDALDKFHLLDLYRGALRIEDREKRLLACMMILCCARLGLRVGEFMHLHEGWINWRYGYIHIPRHEPCGCKYCWKRAGEKAKRANEDDGDDEDDEDGDETEAEDEEEVTIEEMLYTRQWEPKSEMGARDVPFNWSLRITAVLVAWFQAHECIDKDYQYLRRLLNRCARKSRYLEEDDIVLHALRSTAETWWADIDLDTKSRRDMGGWEGDREAWKYSAPSPVELSNKIRDRLGKDRLKAVEKDPVTQIAKSLPDEPFSIRDVDPLARYDPYDPGPVRNPRTTRDHPETGETYDPSRHDSVAVQAENVMDAGERKRMLEQHLSLAAEDYNEVEGMDPYSEVTETEEGQKDVFDYTEDEKLSSLGPLAVLKGSLSMATKFEQWATEKWETHIGIPVFDPLFDFFEKTRPRKAVFTSVMGSVMIYVAAMVSGAFNPSTGALTITPEFALGTLLAFYINLQIFASVLGVSLPGSQIDLVPESWKVKKPTRTDGRAHEGSESPNRSDGVRTQQ